MPSVCGAIAIRRRARDGAIIRGPQLWSDIPSNFHFECGGLGETFLDIVTVDGTVYYKCKRSHTKRQNGALPSPAFWDETPKQSIVATHTLLADNAQLAGFIFHDGELWSREGTIGGQASTNHTAPDFIPNLILNGNTGEIIAYKGDFYGSVRTRFVAVNATNCTLLGNDRYKVSSHTNLSAEGFYDPMTIVLPNDSSFAGRTIHINNPYYPPFTKAALSYVTTTIVEAEEGNITLGAAPVPSSEVRDNDNYNCVPRVEFMSGTLSFLCVPDGSDVRWICTNYPGDTTSEIPGIMSAVSTLGTQVGALQSALSGKASTDHTHNIEDVDGLEDALAQTDASIAGLEAALNDKTSINHTHVIEDVDGLEDALTALETDINTKAPLVSGKIPQAYLPSYVDDVLEYASKAAFPAGGESGKIYISTNDNKTYRWSGSTYVEISASLALGETSSTAYAGDKGRQLRTEVDDLQSTVEGISSTIEGVAYQRSVDALTAKVNALPDLETVITNINFNGNDLTPSEDDPHSVSFTAAAVDHTHTNVYAPNTHSHGINDVNGLQAELQTLDGHLSDVADELSGKAAVSALAGYLPLTGGTLTAANTPLILKSTGSSFVRAQLFRADGAGVEIGYYNGQAFFATTHNANWGLSIYDDGTAAIRNGTETASTTRIILTEQNVGSYALPLHGTAENSYALGGQLPSYYALRGHNANWASVQTYENEGGVVRYYWQRAGRLTGANAVLVFDVVVVDDANYPTNYHGQIVASKYAVSGGGFSWSISGVGSPVVTTPGNNRVTRVDALIDTNGYVWLRANVAWDGSALRFRPVYSYGAQSYSTQISAQLDPPSYMVVIQGNGAQRYHTPTGKLTSSGLSLDGVTVTSAQSATSATYASNAANAAWLGTTTDGSDFKHILEKKGTSASTQFQEHKWYRIGESLRNKGFAQSCILLITQRYNSAECESAAFAISYGWGKAKCSITQLSGSNLMSAIRLVWSGNNSENVYLEVFYNGHATNEFQFTTIGSFTIYDAPFSEGALIDGGNAFAFNTANGFKTSGELWAGDTSFRALHDTITALQSSLGNYLPLTGGTLTGDFTYKRILFYGGDEINTSSGRLNLGYRDTPEGIRLCGANQPLTYGTAARPILHTGNIAQHALTAGNLSQHAATLAGALDEYFNNYTHPEFNVPTTTTASVYRITLDSEGHVTSAQAVDIDAMVQNAASAWAGDAPTWENILDYLGGNNDNLPAELEAAPLSYVRLPKATSSTIGAVKLDNASGLELDSNGAIKVKLGTGLSINSSGQLCASSGATPSGNAPVQVTPLDSLDGQSGINQSSLTQRGWDAGVIEGMMNGTIDRVKIVESSNAWRILPVCYVRKTATELNIRIGSGDDTSGFGLYYIDLWKNLSSGTFTVNIYDNN